MFSHADLLGAATPESEPRDGGQVLQRPYPAARMDGPWPPASGPHGRLPQIHDIVLHTRIEVHVSTELIDGLPGASPRVGMEPPLCALLHQLEAAWSGQPEETASLPRVPRRHNYCHSLIQHRLQANMGIVTDAPVIRA
jgi:hypothetical protein